MSTASLIFTYIEHNNVKINKDGKTIVYSCLTPRGVGALKIAKRRFTRTFLGVFS
jgi:hypothetical protein